MFNYYYADPENNFRDYAAEKMQEQRENVIKLFTRLVGPGLAERMAICVALAYDQEAEEAITIVRELCLTQLDILAVLSDFDDYLTCLSNWNYFGDDE